MNEYRLIGYGPDNLQNSIDAGFALVERYISQFRNGELNDKLIDDFRSECHGIWCDLTSLKRKKDNKSK